MIVTVSYTKHDVNVWLLIVLFLIIEINVWLTYFTNRNKKKSPDETKKLLEDMRDDLLKND